MPASAAEVLLPAVGTFQVIKRQSAQVN